MFTSCLWHNLWVPSNSRYSMIIWFLVVLSSMLGARLWCSAQICKAWSSMTLFQKLHSPLPLSVLIAAKNQITTLLSHLASKKSIFCICCLKGNSQRILVCERLGTSAQKYMNWFNMLGKGQMWLYYSITHGGKLRHKDIEWLHKPRNKYCEHFTSFCLSLQPPGTPSS